MAVPPRMLILVGGGSQALVALPPNFEKALAAASQSFAIPATHHTRLSCKAADVPSWIANFGSADTFTDNDSYNYVCAGKHIVTLEVTAFEKNSGAPAPAPAAAGKAPSAGKGKWLRSLLAAVKDVPTEQAALELHCEARDGRSQTLKAVVKAGDMKKGPGPGFYLGTLSIADKSYGLSFAGRALGPNEVVSNCERLALRGLISDVIHNKTTARLIFRPRSVKPQISVFYPEESSLEVSISIADWSVTGVYPPTTMVADGPRQKLRWFLRAKAAGVVEDLLSGIESFGIFWEGLPEAKERPAQYNAKASLIPAWPDVSPGNAYCLPQELFIPHIDRVLDSLGVPVISRTSMFQSWLPSVTQHKSIVSAILGRSLISQAYRILNHTALPATIALTVIPAPQVMTRVFILFRGIAAEEAKDWEKSNLLQAETGLDWHSAVGWTSAMTDETLFRVIELSAMEVFLC